MSLITGDEHNGRFFLENTGKHVILPQQETKMSHVNTMSWTPTDGPHRPVHTWPGTFLMAASPVPTFLRQTTFSKNDFVAADLHYTFKSGRWHFLYAYSYFRNKTTFYLPTGTQEAGFRPTTVEESKFSTQFQLLGLDNWFPLLQMGFMRPLNWSWYWKTAPHSDPRSFSSR